METKLSAEQWEHTYVRPIRRYVEDGEKPSNELLDGFAGFVLDGIIAIKEVDPEEMNDWDCVEMVEELIQLAKACERDF